MRPADRTRATDPPGQTRSARAQVPTTARAKVPRSGRPDAPASARPGTPAIIRPTREQLHAAAGRTIADVAAPGLRVLFCGINPSLYSAATGYHFGRPGNRFWPALHRCGFTPRLLHPAQQRELLAYGLGITNVVARATARADELTAEELVAGGRTLTATVARLGPGWLAVAGITAYRAAFNRPAARIGPQEETVAGVPVWVLPNPSGLNAHFDLDRLAGEFAALREAVHRET